VSRASRPQGIFEELEALLGPYPAEHWIYGFSWPSVGKTEELSRALCQAVSVRSKAARWLLSERLPSWDLGFVVVSEGHSAIEPLWHGVDPSHPLHNIASAHAAGRGLRDVYRAIDQLIGDLQAAFPDAMLLVFAMHGMGSNDADVAAMLLLPELLYRHAFGSPYMRSIPWAGYTSTGVPLLAEHEVWEQVIGEAVPRSKPANGNPGIFDRLLGRPRFEISAPLPTPPDPSVMDWMPATRYASFWPHMEAFALPSFYDGRIRLNVRGREANGVISRSRYSAKCEEINNLIGECRNVLTDEPVVASIQHAHADPRDVGPSEADLYVIWRSSPLGLWSPRFGSIGPVAYRRTGGHTGAHGFLYAQGDGIEPGDHGIASSFDVVPTLVSLLGEKPGTSLSGQPLALGRQEVSPGRAGGFGM
jgi:hypothetical protein